MAAPLRPCGTFFRANLDLAAPKQLAFSSIGRPGDLASAYGPTRQIGEGFGGGQKVCVSLCWREPVSWGSGNQLVSRVVEVVLPNGTVALVQAAELDEGGGAAEKVGWRETFDFAQVSGTLEGIAQAIRSGLEKAAPAKTTVELGIALAVKNGKLTGLLVDGEASASLKVTLAWDRQPPADGAGRG